jgi:hypothetical protein
VVAAVIVGLVVFCVERLGRSLQAAGLWLAATGLLYGSLAMVLWPRRLVERHAAGVGTRHPGLVWILGIFGVAVALFFEALASAWSGRFHWPTFVGACVTTGICAAVGLVCLGRSLNPAADREEGT